MRKKPFKLIICTFLAAMLAVTATGCALFEHNYDKDYQQVVATIAPITETRKTGELDRTFNSGEKKIYKSQLVASMNTNAQNVINQGYASDLEGAAEYLLNQLIYRQLILAEADRLLFFGDMKWTQKDSNEVTKAVYSSLDSQIASIKKEILTEHDEPTQGDSENTETKTTFPTPPVEEAEEDEDPEKWVPDINRYPAIHGDQKQRSLEREAVRRLVDVLEESVEDDFVATDKEKEYFKRDVEKMRKLIDSKKEEEIYPMLYDADYDAEKNEGNGTYLLEYVLGKSARENRKMVKLEEMVEEGVTVTENEIQEYYNSLVTTQTTSFKTASNYSTAMTSDTTNVVYTPDSNYFYVKHILIPFSDEQKAELTEYKESGLYTAAQIEAFRGRLATQIVSYPHVEGENDLTRPMSVNSIFNTIKSQMSPYRYDAREAERLFDSLTYEYNTDTGAFGSVKGYAVAYELAEGENETYMQEFADAARDMYDTLQVGQLYDKQVITDYGVHIMYLASKTTAGQIKGLNDYQTPAEYKKVKELIEETITANKEAAVFRTWQEEKITYYEDTMNIVTRYEKRYKDLYK